MSPPLLLVRALTAASTISALVMFVSTMGSKSYRMSYCLERFLLRKIESTVLSTVYCRSVRANSLSILRMRE